MIYDCFMFFNELSLLDVRLNLLNKYVDKFVLLESTVTFSGNPKPLYYELNKERFKQFEDKIIHVIIDHTPNNYLNLDSLYSNDEMKNSIINHLKNANHIPKNESHWCREFYQRECIKYGLDCNDNDIIIFSDLDEIPDVSKINFNNIGNSLYHCDQNMYHYFVNVKKNERWFGTKICKFSYLKDKSLNSIRSDKNYSNIIENCGWHFTYFGGVESIKLKIQSYGHQELNRPDILNSIEHNIKHNKDLFYRPDQYFEIDFEQEFPEELKIELRKHQEFFK